MKTPMESIMRTCCRVAASLVMAIAAACGAFTAHAAPVDASTATEIRFVQYVKATGEQYVDTGVIGKSGTKVDITFSNFASGEVLLGAQGETSDSIFAIQAVPYGSINYFCLLYRPPSGQTDTKWYYDAVWSAGDATQHRVCYTVGENGPSDAIGEAIGDEFKNGKHQIREFQIRYWNFSSASPNPGAVDTGRSMYIFALNSNGVADGLATSKSKLYGMKIAQWDATANDYVAVRDFKPCIANVGDVERAGLYDAMQNKIYFSETGTDLVAPDTTPDSLHEWVQPNGNVFVDTGVIGKSWTQIDMTFSNFASSEILLGAQGATSDSIFAIQAVPYGSINYFCLLYRPPSGQQDTKWYVDSVWSPGSDTKLQMCYTVGENGPAGVNGEVVEVVDGNEASHRIKYWNTSNVSPNPGAVDTSRSMYIFALNNNGAANYPATPTSKLYGMKIAQWDATANDYVAVRDFVPCKKNGTVALYDKVSRSVFYPVGTLAAGPEIIKNTKFVEWVESNGSQYVDTGVTGRYGTAIEADFAGCGGDYAALVGAKKSGNRSECIAWTSYTYSGMNMWLVYPRDLSNWYGDKTVVVGAGVRHRMTSSVSLIGDLSVSFDGTSYPMTNWSGAPDPFNLGAANTGLPMYVFAANEAGNAIWKSTTRLYGLRIWQDGVLVRDFRPCVDDNDVPALYDMVSQSLFHSGGGDALAASDTEIPARAVWKGGAVASAADLANAANWTCTDVAGNEIAGAVPGSATTIAISSATDPILSLPSGVSMPAHAMVEVSGVIVLADDADWTHLGSFAFANGTSIDLAGHNLMLYAFSVKTAGTASFGNSGSAQATLTLAGDLDSVFTGVTVGDNVKIVKNGTGDMVKIDQWRVGGATGVEILQNSGDVVVSSSQGEEVLGIGTAGPGTYTVNGGRLKVSNNSSGYSCWIGARGNGIGVMNVTGGEVTMNKTIIVGNWTGGASGMLNISGGSMEIQSGGVFMGNGSALGALNITGGTLALGNGSIYAGNWANVAVTLDGGTIRSGAANAAFFNNLTNVTLGANGLRLETEFDLGMNNTAIKLQSGGKITKVGAGDLDLSGLTVEIDKSMPAAFDFAMAIPGEENGTAGVFTGLPTVTPLHWKAKLVDNGTRCRFVKFGMVIIVR